MEKQRNTQMKGASGSLRLAWNCPAWLWLKSERSLWDMIKGNNIVCYRKHSWVEEKKSQK